MAAAGCDGKNEVSTENKCFRCKVHKPAGELGFVKKSCGFRLLRIRKSSDFFLWLSAKAPSMQSCVLFHSRIYFPYTIVFFVTPLLSFRILVRKNEKNEKKA